MSKILTYQDVLNRIHGSENHLLIGNGFNRGLGINTSYKNIFDKMLEDNTCVYQDALSLVDECDYDLEKFIGKLIADIDVSNSFLKKYVANKVKLDFMKATHGIVKAEIKNIYSEGNNGVYILLSHFSNYFTLNFDPLLYLLLLKYKPKTDHPNDTLAFQTSIKFIEQSMNDRYHGIYREIKEARDNGKLEISINQAGLYSKQLHAVPKSLFIGAITEYSKSNNKRWKAEDIRRVVDQLLSEEEMNQLQKAIDDGSRPQKASNEAPHFIFDHSSATQNLFFLHGAFHIYKDGASVKKITQQSEKALYDRVEEILHHDDQEIVCIFQDENKMASITENYYLNNGLEKLSQISGTLVMIGCSLSENDNHIFNQIESSNIHSIYISAMPRDTERIRQIAEKKFPNQSIHIFKADSITYNLADDV